MMFEQYKSTCNKTQNKKKENTMQKMRKLFLLMSVFLMASVYCGVARADVNPNDGAEMVWVPAGTFTMGSTDADNQAAGDEKPAHTVYLDGYWIYKTEVTVGQYKKFCAATGHAMPNLADGFSDDDHPIVDVSWNDAQAYCAWAGVKLPTEAQWEKAARGTDGRIYPWGNEFSTSKAWTKESGATHTAPVGSFPDGASPYGCLDMAGNVCEWCQDWYGKDYYASSPSSNPTGPGYAEGRVLRGGSWFSDSFYCRCANRDDPDPSLTLDIYGFRCVAPGQ
jgi:formylglycine-generating enzyme required for sulfatase activity